LVDAVAEEFFDGEAVGFADAVGGVGGAAVGAAVVVEAKAGGGAFPVVEDAFGAEGVDGAGDALFEAGVGWDLVAVLGDDLVGEAFGDFVGLGFAAFNLVDEAGGEGLGVVAFLADAGGGGCVAAVGAAGGLADGVVGEEAIDCEFVEVTADGGVGEAEGTGEFGDGGAAVGDDVGEELAAGAIEGHGGGLRSSRICWYDAEGARTVEGLTGGGGPTGH
jgi:hypothetical protein